ncbi:MAG: hypothetical protein AAB091_01610 [Elusimicrobiota bacterium]
MKKWHKNLTIERWSRFTGERQLLMVGSELERASELAGWQDQKAVELCCERAFELIDLTLDDPKWRGQCRRLTRWRELLGESYLSLLKLGASRSKPWWPYLYQQLINPSTF